MKTTLVFAACVLAACAKGGPAQQTAAPAAKAAEEEAAAAKERMAAAAKPAAEGDDLTITSKSPEAIEHFKKGRDLVDNLRNAESVEHFRKAVELDPEFALATAFLGGETPGTEGFTLRARAVDLAKNVPEPERNFIEARQAIALNDLGTARTLLRKVADAKPRDWRVQMALAQLAFNDENWDEAVSASQKALEVGGKSPQPYNLIAYGYAWQGRFDDAIAAAQKQIELLPNEPNPHDSLGEILLAAGRLAEARSEFAKAAELSPAFTLALVGVAQTHMFSGEWKDGYAVLKKAHDTAPRPEDAYNTAYTEMWALAGQGKLADALKLGATIEKKAQEDKREVAVVFAPLRRAQLVSIAGKRADALKLVDQGLARAKEANLPAPFMHDVTVTGESARLMAAAKAKKATDAETAYASLEAEVKKQTVGRPEQSLLDLGQGLVAMSRGDAKAAVESMKKCSQFDTVCRFTLVSAQRAAGDKAGAADTLAKLRASPRRDDAYLYYWSAMK